jgi:hypothetical protein
MSALEQSTFKVTIPVPNKLISRIFGKNGDNIKKIAKDAGNQTRLLYDDNAEIMNIQSNDINSLKIAAKAIAVILNNEKKSANRHTDKPIVDKTNNSVNKPSDSKSVNNIPVVNKNITNQNIISNINDEHKAQHHNGRYLDVLKPSNNNNKKVALATKSEQPVTQNTNVKKVEIPRATRVIKEVRIHPDIIKAELIYQIIGPKGSNIKKICETVGRNCNILCIDNSYYKIDVANEVLFKMAKDMIFKLEKDILNNAENEDIIAKARGYYILNYTNGIKEIVPYEDKSKLIEMYKKKENIRYQLANKMKVSINDIDDIMINDEYNRRYVNDNNENENKQMSIEEIQESFKTSPVTPISSASLRASMYSKWNDDLGIILMKNELPNSVNTLNTISNKLVKAKLLLNKQLDKQQKLEREIIQISLDSLLDDMDFNQSDDDDYYNNDLSSNDISNINESFANDSIIDDDINDINFCENHNKMSDYDEYDNYLDNFAKENKLSMADAWN